MFSEIRKHTKKVYIFNISIHNRMAYFDATTQFAMLSNPDMQ